MILDENKFGYDPDSYDDEPSDYVNSESAYDADDIARDSEGEFTDDDSDNEKDLNSNDVNGSQSTNPAAFHSEGKKPVYIKDMPYIDHATPGVTSN